MMRTVVLSMCTSAFCISRALRRYTASVMMRTEMLISRIGKPSGINEKRLPLLDQTLNEEKKTDATLTEIAETVVNLAAEAA
jgi:hypothetical protein